MTVDGSNAATPIELPTRGKTTGFVALKALKTRVNALALRASTHPTRGRQMHRERGAAAERAVDREPAAVAVEDVLDQCESQAGAALRAAFRDVHAVEALGEPRQM